MKRGEIVDMTLNYLFSEFATGSDYPLTLLPLMNFDTDIDKINAEILKPIENMTKDSKLYVQVLEHYFKLYSLREYLDEFAENMSVDGWKVLFFQILYVLYVITKKYPTFRHNALSLDAVYLYKKGNPSTKTFKVDDKIMVLSKMNSEIRITDFRKSNIAGVITNNDAPPAVTEENSYYDVHYIFSSIIIYLQGKGLYDELHKQVKDFIDEIVPEKSRSDKKKFSGLDEALYEKNVTDILTPSIILTKNNFFTDLIKENIMNSPENVNSYGIRENSIEYPLSETSLTVNSDSPLLLAQQIGGKAKKQKKSKKQIKGKRPLKKQMLPKNYKQIGLTENKFDVQETLGEELEESVDLSDVDEIFAGYPSDDSPDDYTDEGYGQPSGNVFMNLFNEKVPGHQTGRVTQQPRKSRGSKKSKRSNINNPTLSQLPDGFEGRIPEWMQDRMGEGSQFSANSMGSLGSLGGLDSMENMGSMGSALSMDGLNDPQMDMTASALPPMPGFGNIPGMDNGMMSMMPGFSEGMPPQGMPPQGMPPQGMPPQGMPPQGMPPQGMDNGMMSMVPGLSDGLTQQFPQLPQQVPQQLSQQLSQQLPTELLQVSPQALSHELQQVSQNGSLQSGPSMSQQLMQNVQQPNMPQLPPSNIGDSGGHFTMLPNTMMMDQGSDAALSQAMSQNMSVGSAAMNMNGMDMSIGSAAMNMNALPGQVMQGGKKSSKKKDFFF